MRASRQVFSVKQGIENISLTSMQNCFFFLLTLTAVAATSCKPFCNQSGNHMGKRLLNHILSVFFVFFVLLLRFQHPGWKSFPLISPSQTIWYGSNIHLGSATKRFLIFTPHTCVYLLYQFSNKQIYITIGLFWQQKSGIRPLKKMEDDLKKKMEDFVNYCLILYLFA